MSRGFFVDADFREYQTACAGLQGAGNCGLHVFAYGVAAIFDHDHGAVGEEADALACLFACTQDADADGFAWSEIDLCGVGEVVEIEG